jgi:sigma-E factor negative regulatory protein RseB
MTRAARVLDRHLLQSALAAVQALALAGIAPAATAQADVAADARVSPAAYLARMAAAVDDLTYEGTLVYLADNRLETLHIVHRVADGGVEERLISLSGPVRAVARQGDEVTCVLSEDHPISVKRKAGVPDLLRTRAIDPATLAANYFVHPLGETRVAGRDTDVVGVIPRDSYRYGYRFYLDRQTGLPLKSDLMGTAGDPIEQIMFTTVQVAPAADSPAPSGPDGGKPEPAGTPSGALGARSEDPRAASSPVSTFVPWRFDALPPGFAVRLHDSWPEGPEGKVEHFLVTDHLASVSVFVEAAGQGGLTGATRIGAVHAVGGRVAGHQVTVVGQVPAETVSSVLAGLHHHVEGQR